MPERSVDTVLVRMDKLGDLVLSLSADEHPACRGSRTHWFVTKGLGFVAERAVPRRAATEFARAFSFGEFRRMVGWLRAHRPRTIILLHCPWWVSMAAWVARVPERVGRQSQWHSFLFLNVPIRQKRSRADRHESEFNFELIERAAQRIGLRQSTTMEQTRDAYLRLSPPDPRGTLISQGLKSRGYYVVHPGMFGSALNWPPERYVQLIERLAVNTPVVITGTQIDRKYLVDVESVRSHPNVRWLVDELRLPELLDVLAEARAVVAPSTGVVHLAASLGTPTVGIYSPRRVEHPRRWGPRGPRATFVVPPAQAVDMIHPDVMKEVSAEDVLAALAKVERDPNPEPRL